MTYLEESTRYGQQQDEYAAAVSAASKAYRAEFPGQPLDTEWSETAYADLSSEIQAEHAWSEFHEDVANHIVLNAPEIKATASDAYELLTSVKMGATLYYDSQDDALVVSSNIRSAWHDHYTPLVTQDAANTWMDGDFQGDSNEPTDTDCEMLAQWINENISQWMAAAKDAQAEIAGMEAE